jgi:hypothetical protein
MASRVDELEDALRAQREPLADVDNATQRGFGLVEDAVAQGRASAASFEGPVWDTWKSTHGFLKSLAEESRLHSLALDQHQLGLQKIEGKQGFEFDQYVNGMANHFKQRLGALDATKELYLDTSAQVGAQAQADPDDPELEKMDTLMTLMGYALGDLRRRGGEYVKELDAIAPNHQLGPDAGLDLGALVTAPLELADGSYGTALAPPVSPTPAALVAAGPNGRDPVSIHDYILTTYGVEMLFEAGGRPLLDPIDGPVYLGPGAGLDHGLEPEPELSISA